jgi:hypothetical protein
MGIAAVVEAAATALEIEASAATLAAVTAGVRMVATIAIASIVTRAISPSQPGQSSSGGTSGVKQGTRIQLPPGTTNKIPVVYGTAWVKGIITDAVISADNQTMWYVMALSEYPENTVTLDFNRIMWGDKDVNFADDGYTVASLTASDSTVDTKVAGKIRIYTYSNGSGNPVNVGIPAWSVVPGWDTNKTMDGLTFLIVSIDYDSNAGTTSLPDMSVELTNSLSRPGDVIKDYFLNARYGMNLPLTQIDQTSLTNLNAYSDQTITYIDKDNNSQTAPRFRINGPIDTSQSFLTSLQAITDSCDSWVTWNEAQGVWSITMNKAYTGTPQRIGSDQLIGGIDIHPIDINSTYNSVEVQFPNNAIKDQSSYFTYNLTDFPAWAGQRSPYEHDNQLKITLPFTNNQIEAQYVAARRLLTSRINTTIMFNMTFQGLRIDASDVIGIDHDYYGWGSYSSNSTEQSTGKLFRVQQVAEVLDNAGNLYVKIVAATYDPDIYIDDNIALEQTNPPSMTGLADPSFLSQPPAPTIIDVNPLDKVPNFTVKARTPNVGSTQAMEYWYNVDSTTTSMSLWATEHPSSGSQFVSSSTVTSVVTALTSGTYYWCVRAVGARTKSPFSQFSSATNWNPTTIALVTGNVFLTQFQPGSYVIQQDYLGNYNFNGISPHLLGTLGNGTSTFVTAQTDNDPRFTTGTWRIGLTTATGFTDIFADGITIASTATASTSSVGAYAIFSQPTTVTNATSLLNVPVRYKDALGVAYSGGTAVLSFGVAQSGGQGTPGITVFGYVEVNFDPTTSTISQSLLTGRWTSTYGRAPQNLDGASFYYVSTGTSNKVLDITGAPIHKFWTYYDGTTAPFTTGWSPAVVEFPGDVISTGTIRGNMLVANAIYGKSFQSLNATLDDNGSAGAWIDGSSGNARFGGSVNIGDNATIGANLSVGDSVAIGNDVTIGNNLHIGNNLTVEGLINNGQLAEGIITTSTLSTNLYNNIFGTDYGNLGTSYGATSLALNSEADYDWYYARASVSDGFWKTIAWTKYNAPVAGRYNVSFRANFSGTFAAGRCYIVLFANNAKYGGNSSVGIYPFHYFLPDGIATGAPYYTTYPPGATTETAPFYQGSFMMNPYQGLQLSNGTSYTGPININKTFTFPLRGDSTSIDESTVVVGAGIMNGYGYVGNSTYDGTCPGNVSFDSINWNFTKGL